MFSPTAVLASTFIDRESGPVPVFLGRPEAPDEPEV